MPEVKAAACPECDAGVELEKDVMESEIVECPDCGIQLEVVSENNTFVLKPAPEEEEDWGE